MEDHALRETDYDFIEWQGCPPIVRLPLGMAPSATPVAPACDGTESATISLFSDEELRYWTNALGATIYELRDAFAVTGTRCARTVRAYLRRRETQPDAF